MRSFAKPVVFGLLWLAFSTAAFGASGATSFIRQIPESAIFGLAGAGLILLGVFRRRRGTKS